MVCRIAFRVEWRLGEGVRVGGEEGREILRQFGFGWEDAFLCPGLEGRRSTPTA